MIRIIILLLFFCTGGQGSELFYPSLAENVLTNSLIDKPRPLKNLNSSSTIERAVSIGFYASSFQDYLNAIDSFEVSDRLIGYMSHVLAKADPIILDPFHYPFLKEWQSICVELGCSENDLIQFVNLLDESRQKLLESLKGKHISSQRVEFYIPPLIDILLLNTFISYPASIDGSLQSLDIFQRMAESQKTYDTPLELVDSLIETSSKDKTEQEKNVLNWIRDQWLTAYKKQLSLVSLNSKRKDELGEMLSKLTIRFVTQGEDISSYANLLFDKALTTPLFTLGTLEKVVNFCDLHGLLLEEQKSSSVLKALKSLDVNNFHTFFQKRTSRYSVSNSLIPFNLTKSILKMKILGISNSSSLEHHIDAVFEILSYPIIKLEDLEFICRFCTYFNLVLERPTKKVILAQLRIQAVDSQQTVKSIARLLPLLAYQNREKYEFLDILLELNQEHFNRFFERGINLWFDQLGISKVIQPSVNQPFATTLYPEGLPETFHSQASESLRGNFPQPSIQETLSSEFERLNLSQEAELTFGEAIYNCCQNLIEIWIASYII